MSNTSFLDFLEAQSIAFEIQENIENHLTLSFKIWAKPGSKVEKIQISEEGELIINIRQKPIDGKANIAFTKALSKYFGVSAAQVDFLSGQKSKHKKFLVSFTFTKNKDMIYYQNKILEFDRK